MRDQSAPPSTSVSGSLKASITVLHLSPAIWALSLSVRSRRRGTCGKVFQVVWASVPHTIRVL